MTFSKKYFDVYKSLNILYTVVKTNKAGVGKVAIYLHLFYYWAVIFLYKLVARFRQYCTQLIVCDRFN